MPKQKSLGIAEALLLYSRSQMRMHKYGRPTSSRINERRRSSPLSPLLRLRYIESSVRTSTSPLRSGLCPRNPLRLRPFSPQRTNGSIPRHRRCIDRSRAVLQALGCLLHSDHIPRRYSVMPCPHPVLLLSIDLPRLSRVRLHLPMSHPSQYKRNQLILPEPRGSIVPCRHPFTASSASLPLKVPAHPLCTDQPKPSCVSLVRLRSQRR